MLLQLLSATASTVDDRKLQIGERNYILIDEEIVVSSPAPYTAVSYAWGSGRKPDPLHDGHNISDRTVAVLTACAQHRPIQTRFWVDAFCVHLPEGSEAQNRDLESMGFIYNAAAEVIVVLSPGAQVVLREIVISDGLEWKGLSDPSLLKLEDEDWISRAWTYQELVNQNLIFFTCEDAEDVLVDGSQFLNALGYSLSLLRNRGSDLSNSPRLNAFEDAIQDWRISGYCGRSALQVMANMDNRVAGRPEDHFYAMIGALTTKPKSELKQTEASEAFMVACEAKNDYSFIYSAAPRSTIDGRQWRPKASLDIRAILPWSCSGEGQPGRFENDTLILEKMAIFQPNPLDLIGTDFLNQWLTTIGFIKKKKQKRELADASLRYLISIGFRSCDQCVYLSCGLFFPYESVPSEVVCSIAISTTVFWVFGAPGIAYYEEEDKLRYIPGVFVGDTRTSAPVDIHLY
ncbi:hypothetical protein E2P81_ATG04827 [Venturia nashicola]|nr:hypothetical protein E2P81_ATG04827 [Venturia nashicola]